MAKKMSPNTAKLVMIAVVLVILLQISLMQASKGEGFDNQVSVRTSVNAVANKHYSIHTDIYETLAQTNITYVYENSASSDSEVFFQLRIPSKAFLTNASLTAKGHTFWAKVLPKTQAQNVYQNATQAGRSAVLISEISKNVFQVDLNVANF